MKVSPHPAVGCTTKAVELDEASPVSKFGVKIRCTPLRTLANLRFLQNTLIFWSSLSHQKLSHLQQHLYIGNKSAKQRCTPVDTSVLNCIMGSIGSWAVGPPVMFVGLQTPLIFNVLYYRLDRHILVLNI